ncbi:serine/threonine-protein kinase [Hamadaea tsunoensis]|uniref:serine/threonine-protein kinase n=1 Tax=Hamadaea tsunoensis TaxID=53368 RepID=UPI00146FA759|nr:serine/threonine-protein kinase [Hamadaea tsunoensis]
MPPTNPSQPLMAHDPQKAGRYRLLGRLGAGGQGVVYLGEDPAGTRVAVKTINADLVNDPKAKARFAKEIAAARQVAPFCTAQVLDADLDGEPPFVVSEFIEGRTLFQQVRDQGPLPANNLYRLAVGTATALAAIHQAGVVHCDFKPDNVILGEDGPRVIDFGIARAYGHETMSSGVIGTVPYMAPERFRNVDVGPACDIFAWAATIAYAAAARPPFGNDGVAAVMERVMSGSPDLAGLNGPLRDLVTDCLAKDQRVRPTAQQVVLRLLAYTGKDPSPTQPMETVLQAGTDAATAVVPTARAPWGRRLARQLADPRGAALAIFLGAAGTATTYIASTVVTTAAVAGAATFAVVYAVRAVAAAALVRD